MAAPEKRFRVGACSASVFANSVPSKDDAGMVSFRTVSLQRAYKDKDGNFQHTCSFKEADIPKAILALSQAYKYLVMDEKAA